MMMHWLLAYRVLFFATLITVAQLYPSKKSEENDEPGSSESDSWELGTGNENDRSLGFGKGGKVNAKNYQFHATPSPSWTESPEMIKKVQDAGFNDIDEGDKDYFAHYDFEFAKSGMNNHNFQQKYLKYQERYLEEAKKRKEQGIPEPKEGEAK